MSLATHQDSAFIHANNVPHLPLFAAISVSTIGDNTIVAAVTGKQIRVIAYVLQANAAVVGTWKSSVAGAISGPMSDAQNGGKVCGYNPAGWCQTAIGEALVLNLNGNVSVGGHLTYITV